MRADPLVRKGFSGLAVGQDGDAAGLSGDPLLLYFAIGGPMLEHLTLPAVHGPESIDTLTEQVVTRLLSR